MSELLSIWNHQVILGIAQAAAAVALCLAVVFMCRWFAVHVERETAFSLARGFLQMGAVGMLLAALLHGSLPIAICILVGMTFAAAVTAARRAPGISRPRLLSFCAIAAGGGIAIAVMLATGTLTSDLIVLVPVGSMLIANAMNAQCKQRIIKPPLKLSLNAYRAFGRKYKNRSANEHGVLKAHPYAPQALHAVSSIRHDSIATVNGRLVT